jgi:two-component system response regulator FlrC
LRERPDDILPLARAMLARHVARQKRRVPTFTLPAQACLTAYEWEGNIRELDNVVQRALILAPGDTIDLGHLYLPELPAKIAGGGGVLTADGEPAAVLDIKQLEKRHILETLHAVGGVRKLAAEKLNMSERTLRHKLQQYREQSGDLHI